MLCILCSRLDFRYPFNRRRRYKGASGGVWSFFMLKVHPVPLL
ncbi:hypothetical protein KNP414_03967 [Paenibacillus mucilaginosus KNP414]|uniref:Uncharacterized protein n=1 Tax=Paenibacillus mucilaginosus (strain KNP414) TaxID=1036673 RepID=F8FBD8_PAEMK|nr:hypothetical protein KNP414_03967 [Paenibacillus mucilaginosus KNP414]